MHRADVLGFSRIGVSARYPQVSVTGAGRQAQTIHGQVEPSVVTSLEPADFLGFVALYTHGTQVYGLHRLRLAR